jgi:hypothetical protein
MNKKCSFMMNGIIFHGELINVTRGLFRMTAHIRLKGGEIVYIPYHKVLLADDNNEK